LQRLRDLHRAGPDETDIYCQLTGDKLNGEHDILNVVFFYFVRKSRFKKLPWFY